MKNILLICIFFLGLSVSAQKTNEFRIYYGISESDFLTAPEDGGGSYDNEKLHEFGLRYLRTIFERFQIETGFNYSKSNVKIKPEFMGMPVQTRYEKLELISIPIFVNYTLWHYAFINGGPLLDFQLSDNSTDKQSGIGYSLGFGGKYSFKNFLIFINPNFKRHAVISFKKSIGRQHLTEVGIQFGIGYTF